MTLAIWATILILLALLLLLAELFIPSGGLIAAFAAVSLVGGLVCLFLIDVTAGLTGVVMTLVVLPILAAGAIKVFPHTPAGRATMLSTSQRAGSITYDRNVSRSGSELVGLEGLAETDLRPVGSVRIDGKRIECFSEGGVILAGTRVKVTRIQGMEIKVRPA
ncbi:MAG: NfeD family protein [Phycisphaeraceae bacterium]